MNEYCGSLSVSTIDEEFHRRTCGYWYLVMSAAYSHTAFATEAGLMQWMNERNLKLTQPLPKKGEVSNQRIEGGYFRNTMMDEEGFAALEAVTPDECKIKIMDNGDWTLGLLTENEDGVVTVHLLNPNCNRIKYPQGEKP